MPLVCSLGRCEFSRVLLKRSYVTTIYLTDVKRSYALRARPEQSSAVNNQTSQSDGKLKYEKKNFTYPEKIVNACPAFLRPYLKLMRLDRTTGLWVIYLPGTWGVCMAADAGCLPDSYHLALFGIGAILMRGAGCTVNDLWDHDIDKKVERTKDRPLPSELVTVPQAIALLALQLTAALGILLQLNPYSVVLGAAAVVPVCIYPAFKRITYYPQFFLGLTLNWGVLLGYSAIKGFCDWTICMPLYFAGVFWSVFYDTVYAYQDRKDDLSSGVKSLAIKLGDHPKSWLTATVTVMTACLFASGISASQSMTYFLFASATYGWLLRQIQTLDIDRPKSCEDVFIAQKKVGLLIAVGIVIGNLMSYSR